MKFSITDFFSKCEPNPQEIADLVTFTGEIRNGKLHFCAVSESDMISKKLQNSDFIYCNVNLMTDVFKTVVKYREKIDAKYRQISLFIAYWEPNFNGKLHFLYRKSSNYWS